MSCESSGPAGSPDHRIAPVYDELRRIAGRLLGAARSRHTLTPTAVVHEAYLKLAAADSGLWESEAHFLAVAAKALRQVLVDHARTRRRLKRGGDGRRLSLDTSVIGGDAPATDAVEIDDALRRLEDADPRAAAVVELRFFGGMTLEQIAEHLGQSASTVERDWHFARTWLYDALFGEAS